MQKTDKKTFKLAFLWIMLILFYNFSFPITTFSEGEIVESSLMKVVPEAEVLPEVEVAPEAEVLPEVEVAPEAEVLPEVEVIPEAEVLPEVEVAPEAEVLPEVEVIPEAEVLPEAEVIPEAEVVPEAEVLPEAEEVLPEAEVLPEVTEQPPVEPAKIPRSLENPSAQNPSEDDLAALKNEKEKAEEKKNRMENRSDFIFDITEKGFSYDVFKEITPQVYKIDQANLTAAPELPESMESSFLIVDKGDYYSDENNLYFIDLFFSQDFNAQDIFLDSFTAEDIDGEKYNPSKIFLLDREIILIFSDMYLDPQIRLLNLKNVRALDKSILDGDFLLSDNFDKYVELTSNINSSYDAYFEDDIVFNEAKLSFGDLNAGISSGSTILVEIKNSPNLSPDCAILVFGADLYNEDSESMISISLNLLSRNQVTIPFDEKIISNYEDQKQKKFLGFAYLRDLELFEDYYQLYLNLSAPEGTTAGKYQSVASFEMFCSADSTESRQ